MTKLKKAVLIGCNYSNSSYKLEGCINDVYQMKKVLIDVFKYTDILMLTDNGNDIEPTYSNIISNLTKLVELSNSLDEIYLHYSGHGLPVKDTNNDEPDGYDEGILSLDLKTITDNILFDIFFSKVNSSCKVICVFDSCNSGSISDLNYSWLSDGKKCYVSTNTLTNRKPLDKKIFVLSGCVDDKLSYEIIDPETNQKSGALSLKLRKLLQENNWILSVQDLIVGITQKLKSQSNIQTPVLTLGFNADQNELVFVNPNP